jgi:hypothetical protein
LVLLYLCVSLFCQLYVMYVCRCFVCPQSMEIRWICRLWLIGIWYAGPMEGMRQCCLLRLKPQMAVLETTD